VSAEHKGFRVALLIKGPEPAGEYFGKEQNQLLYVLALNKYIYVGNMPSILRDPSGKFWPILIGAIVGAVIGAVDASINGGNFLERVLRGATGGALFGIAAMISPDAALLSLAVSFGSAGLKGGNFFRNLNDSLVSDGAKAIVAGGIDYGFNQLIAAPLIGSIFMGPAVATNLIGISMTVIGINNTACDPDHGGSYRSDFCSISRGINGN